jgi:hypothetical protein
MLHDQVLSGLYVLFVLKVRKISNNPENEGRVTLWGSTGAGFTGVKLEYPWGRQFLKAAQVGAGA